MLFSLKYLLIVIVVIAIGVAGAVIYFNQQEPAQSPSTSSKVETGIEAGQPQSNVCVEDCGGAGITKPSPGEEPQKQTTQEQTTQQRITQEQTGGEQISVKAVNSSYKIVSAKPMGFFKTGQNADIMLSGIDFNNAGNSLLFNHPGNIAADGIHLVLADRNNNRVLIWNKLPSGNTAPDLVLGQKNFFTNNPGASLDNLNWPVGAAIGGGKLIVADTYNDRILIWNTFPAQNGQAADIEIKDPDGGPQGDPKQNISWPWAVWTDGQKLVVTATGAAGILIWNTFPSKNNQPADISIVLPKKIGTPRSVGSDGKHLVVGDHNAGEQGNQGTFFWKSFPTYDNQPYDFVVGEVSQMGFRGGGLGSLLWGPLITPDGKLIGVSDRLYIWNSFPENESDTPDLAIGAAPNMKGGYDFGGGQSGDGSGIALAGNKLYVSLSNGNKIVGFNSIPIQRDQKPDFAVGSSDINTNTLLTSYFATNPKAATDGKSLFVAGPFEKRLYVWKSLPDESGAKPNFVYDNFPTDVISIIDGSLLIVGNGSLYVWNKPPLSGEMPDLVTKKIGSISFEKLGGVARDQKYFYASDAVKNKLYVWEGNPIKNSSLPVKYAIDIESPFGFTSDGKYLAFGGNNPKFYRISEFPNPTKLTIPQRFNLPGDFLVYDNKLFAADTVFNRVQIWNSIDDALANKEPDVILGQNNSSDIKPAIGRNRLFWPNSLAFDGSFLWVGEYKFSQRVLRFSVTP